MGIPGSGRRQKVEVIYAELAPALLLYARALVRDRSIAEDLVQQAFANLLSGFRPLPAAPKPYLYRTVRNAAINRQRRNEESPQRNEEPWFAPDGTSAIVVQQALAELPPEQREIVVMKIWGDLTFEEAAAALNISPNTAASRYRYALAKLREQIGEGGK